MDVSPNIMFSIFAAGIGFAFLLSKDRAATTIALAVYMFSIAATGFLNSSFLTAGSAANLPWWAAISGLPIALAAISAQQWLLLVRRTITEQTRVVKFGNFLIRLAQLLALLFGILTLIFHEQRADMLLGLVASNSEEKAPIFFLFMGMFLLSITTSNIVLLLTLLRETDEIEKGRLIAFTVSVPIAALGVYQGPGSSAVAITIALIVIVIGAFRHQTALGQRAAFMSRFLAPQVASVIQQRGFHNYLEDNQIEMSVVFCDLRGFTRWAANHSPGEVLSFLRNYYDVVGLAAAESEATIKDYAGDGVMLLVGAPSQRDDHASEAVNLAIEIRRRVEEMLKAEMEDTLAVGVGVASGTLRVGVVGGNRLEYAAVGSATNLAARLCDKAESGAILLSETTAAAMGNSLRSQQLSSEEKFQLKGLDEPVAAFRVL